MIGCKRIAPPSRTISEKKLKNSEIKHKLHSALQRLLRDDCFLLVYDVHEQAITHRIAVYLESMFPDHHVDCEYNNDLDSKSGRKQIRYLNDEDASMVRPDILVHHRGLNGKHHNILIVEVKKSTCTKIDLNPDIDKLSEFTSQNNHFCYQCGALVKLGVKDNTGIVKIIWFENGSSNDIYKLNG